MDGTDGFVCGFGLCFILYTLFEVFQVVPNIQQDIMKQAYDRGYAVECLGETGYYWGCEGE